MDGRRQTAKECNAALAESCREAVERAKQTQEAAQVIVACAAEVALESRKLRQEAQSLRRAIAERRAAKKDSPS